MNKPKLIIFDLDYTLWPFWVDTHVGLPIKVDKNNQIIDASGQLIKSYPEVPRILDNLTKEGFILGLASRTEWPEGAKELIQLFDWNKYFTYQEIYPGRKTTHFKKIHENSGVDFTEMMFFDDEERNIRDIKNLGVTCIFVPDGVNEELVKEALENFKKS